MQTTAAAFTLRERIATRHIFTPFTHFSESSPTGHIFLLLLPLLAGKMSSAADSAGGATTSQWYFCHQCNATASIVPPISADPLCPICGSSFVEELEFSDRNPIPMPIPSPSPFFSVQASAFGPLLTPSSASASASALPFITSPGSVEIRSSGDFAGLLGLDSSPSGSQPLGFDPQLFVRDHIQSIFSGGASIQVIFDGGGGNIGDYAHGSGLEHLIQQLFENDPNRYGPPPAAKSAVEALPVIRISDEMAVGDDEAQCAVCKDVFEVGAEAMEMPCKHMYHKDCIVPWLELHNSCPVCRYELPTDDPDYVQRVVRLPEVGGEQRPSASGRRGMNRRVRISLPWPLRGLGAQAEWSGDAGGVSDSSGSGSRDENLEGRRSSGPDPGHQDLD